MQSLGSSTMWSSRESLSSTPSFPYSESDQTEDDDCDVFSEGEIDSSRAPLEHFSLAATERPPHFDSAGYRRDQQELPAATGGQLVGAGSGEATVHHGQQPSTLSHPPPTERDMAFSRKCRELQRYLRPLLELLHGLKTGRFDKGLSTFQQSVAMDRLQRIVGVLQKPHLGERYLHTLQQIETMLKVWFPQVRVQHSLPDDRQSTSSNPSHHWHQDQLHIPVKKRRRSWSDSDSSSSIPPVSKRPQSQQSRDTVQSEEDNSISSELSGMTGHAACSHKEKRGGGRGGEYCPPLAIPPPSAGGQTDTQDSFISSTTPTSHRPHLPRSEHYPLGRGSQPDTANDKVGGAKGRGTRKHDQSSGKPKQTGSSYCSLSRSCENT